VLQKTWLSLCVSSLCVLSFCVAAGRAAETATSTLAGGLKNPQGVAVTDDGRIFVTVPGEPGKSGAGAVLLIQDGKATPFASGFDDPRGIVAHRNSLFVTDKNRVWKIDGLGKPTVLAAAAAFPVPPHNLSAIAVEFEGGALFVADTGDDNGQGAGAGIFRIGTGGDVDWIVEGKGRADFGTPSGILLDGQSFLLVADSKRHCISRVKIEDSSIETIREGIREISDLAWDPYGRLFISGGGKGDGVLIINRPGSEPVLLPGGEPSKGICPDRQGHLLMVTADAVKSAKIVVPGAEVDDSPMPLEAVTAFPKLQWTGWSGETPEGKVVHHRPIVLTHSGDGSNRVFVATEHGVIHVFPNDPNAEKTEIFLDIQDRVRYNDKQDEEGFLGLTFHPRYKENGEFFVFYTVKQAKKPHTNVISRFHVRKENPNQADPASEEVLLTIEHPFWNHDGGTLAFGPDGYLYIAAGDGGLAADPFRNGQNRQTLLGKILRIDVDHKEGTKAYAIPKDNPFVSQADARPEIFCYGLRNVWRFSFDRETHVGWASDVGQDLWEEINLIVPGGNYGWNIREALHPFGAKGVGPRPNLIDPIWEYHHSIGKSVTGGGVYRGSQLPELRGAYLYADYIAGTVFALRYDPDKKRVVANQPIRTPKLPIVSFGEDQAGEMYFLSITANGRGISRFERTKLAAKGN
jgi:glucose/arabinose dehydrogenase